MSITQHFHGPLKLFAVFFVLPPSVSYICILVNMPGEDSTQNQIKPSTRGKMCPGGMIAPDNENAFVVSTQKKCHSNAALQWHFIGDGGLNYISIGMHITLLVL